MEIQNQIKDTWVRKPYLQYEAREVSQAMSWFILKAWRELEFTNEDGSEICPLCGYGKSWLHNIILVEWEALEE